MQMRSVSKEDLERTTDLAQAMLESIGPQKPEHLLMAASKVLAAVGATLYVRGHLKASTCAEAVTDYTEVTTAALRMFMTSMLEDEDLAGASATVQ